MLMGIAGLVNGGDKGVLDICSTGALSMGDSGNQSAAFDNIYYDENNCNACGWAPDFPQIHRHASRPGFGLLLGPNLPGFARRNRCQPGFVCCGGQCLMDRQNCGSCG
jgi:hypothetical protein